MGTVGGIEYIAKYGNNSEVSMTIKELIKKLENLSDEEKKLVEVVSVDGASDHKYHYEYFEVRIPEVIKP